MSKLENKLKELLKYSNSKRENSYLKYVSGKHQGETMFKLYHEDNSKKVVEGWVDENGDFYFGNSKISSSNILTNPIKSFIDDEDGNFEECLKNKRGRTKQTCRPRVGGKAPRNSHASMYKKKVSSSLDNKSESSTSEDETKSSSSSSSVDVKQSMKKQLSSSSESSLESSEDSNETIEVEEFISYLKNLHDTYNQITRMYRPLKQRSQGNQIILYHRHYPKGNREIIGTITSSKYLVLYGDKVLFTDRNRIVELLKQYMNS